MKSSTSLSEKKVNQLISQKLNNPKLLCISEVRLQSGELDIILLHKDSLKLINIEIKKNKWKQLLNQSIRRKLFCHYSIAILPEKYKDKIPIEEFSKNGIGLVYYKEFGEELSLELQITPTLSYEINRYYKQILYKLFLSRFGDLVYA